MWKKYATVTMAVTAASPGAKMWATDRVCKLDGIAGSAVTARCPIRLRATLIRSSAAVGCLRASQ